MAIDAVIIGAGAGGAAAAWRLCNHGLKVLILEAGPRFDPATDYPLTNTDWERTGFPIKPGSTGAVSYGDLGALDPADADLASWNAVSGRQVNSTKRPPSATGYAHVQGVGGSTLQYVGEAHRLNPAAFRLQSDHGAGADWPLSFADLEPHYRTIEAEIGVAGAPIAGARWSAQDHLQPAHPLSTSARVLRDAGTRMGMAWETNTRAALSEPKDNRPNCNYCGNCTRGCPLGDKGSADVTFIRKAEATGRLTIHTGAQVTRLIMGANGRVRAVSGVRDGAPFEQDTPILILAGGAVQTPRLLLANDMANGSGQVGRNFMETLAWTSAGLLPGLTNSHKGLPADAVSWTYNAQDAVPGVVGGCRFTASTQETGLLGPMAYASRILDGYGPAFKAQMRNVFGSAIAVAGTGETIPDERSFVALDPQRVDAAGVPFAQINSVLTDNSLALLRFMASQCRAILTEAGVTELAEENGVWDRFTSTHVFGTCRMGADAATSVVDPFGRSHDIDNLYIVDASTFPSSGGGEAPVSTIQALALRMADRLVA
ncbi:GMC family oxidoreductase [uncultured Tateyamaria sp.]|uniref:GMC family oxidoreductase n=1 Tax=uncultured Tateyamaria sp. TaxID=455651 RepID=UPI00261B18AE|nr:GMC family oxidoreductase [uncultured Tateyamaria sp.]